MTLSRAQTIIDTMPGEEIHRRMVDAQIETGGYVSFGGALYRIIEMDRLLAAGTWRWFLREVIASAGAS